MANENLIIHWDEIILTTPIGEHSLKFRGKPDIKDGKPKANTVPYIQSGATGVTTDVDHTEAFAEVKVTIPYTAEQEEIVDEASEYQGQNTLILKSNTSFKTNTINSVSVDKANPTDGAFEVTFRGQAIIKS